MAGDAMDSMAAGTIEGSATYNDALGSITAGLLKVLSHLVMLRVLSQILPWVQSKLPTSR